MENPDVWVGSWRPHMPRGPIAAMYNSPGPKYALPGVTGHEQHDPQKWRAPAYSFGILYKKTQVSCSPGPAYFLPSNTTRTGQSGNVAFSIYGRIKEPKRFQTPGPGSYHPEKAGAATYKSPPSYSLSARTKYVPRDHTPGPAAYTLPAVVGPKSVNIKTAPSFSLSGRNKVGNYLEDFKKNPGPATYKVVDPQVCGFKSPQYSILGRNNLPGDRLQKPGPGAHRPEEVTATKAQAPSFSFGVRHSDYIAPLITTVSDQPALNKDC